MNALTVRLPQTLHNTLKMISQREGCSVNQFIASAAAEKISAVLTLDHLRAEAAKASREDFLQFLSAVPDEKPIETDVIR